MTNAPEPDFDPVARAYDLVRDYVDTQAGDEPAKRWHVFQQLISSPRLPSGLQ